MTDFFKGTLMDEGLKKNIFKQKHLVRSLQHIRFRTHRNAAIITWNNTIIKELTSHFVRAQSIVKEDKYISWFI